MRSQAVAHDVFISYSHHDKPEADAVCARLEAEGIRCWIAPGDVVPGEEWGASIVDAIRTSRVMVLVFSRHANVSPQIRREVERAVNAEIVLIPFRIEDVAPERGLEYFLGTPHWLDALTPPLEAHLDRVAVAVAGFLEANEPAKAKFSQSAAALHAPDTKLRRQHEPTAPSYEKTPSRSRRQRQIILVFVAVLVAVITVVATMALIRDSAPKPVSSGSSSKSTFPTTGSHAAPAKAPVFVYNISTEAGLAGKVVSQLDAAGWNADVGQESLDSARISRRGGQATERGTSSTAAD
jgi:hypothetical protein